MSDTKPYQRIVDHYESCLVQHGDTHQGVDWPNQQDALTRYQIMLDVIQPVHRGQAASLLDFGCGAAHLCEYIKHYNLDWIDYSGLDISARFIELARTKFPAGRFYLGDWLNEGTATLQRFDYIVLNGVLTEKRDLAHDEMWNYTQRLLRKVFAKTNCGIAFNVMSKHVDWEREELFHLPLDMLVNFLSHELSRHFVIRNDYGLHEYTVYVYQDPVTRWAAARAKDVIH